MPDAAEYSAAEVLRNGRRIEVRALRPSDRADLLAAVDRTSAQSLYRRFFGARRGFTDQEIAAFLKVDFVRHVALVAVVEEGGQPVIVGGGRYVVVEPGKAEVAFTVVDQYQGQGIGGCAVAPCRHDRAHRRTKGADRGGSAGQRRDAQGVRDERPPPRCEARAGGGARHAAAAPGLISSRTAVPPMCPQRKPATVIACAAHRKSPRPRRCRPG